MKRKIRWDIVLVIISIICFGIYGFISYNNLQLENKADITRQRISTVKSDKQNNERSSSQKENSYQNLFETNKDMIAWLSIPGTNIDYPVMQTINDEEYYLYRDFFGEDDKNGTLFMDTGSNINDKRANLIIHGHNMKSGAMFGTLEKYADEDYCKKNSKIYMYMKNETRIYEIVSVFKTKIHEINTEEFAYYNYFKFDSQEEFETYYENIMNMSLYNTKVSAEFGDEFVTLSTCSYHTKEGRFVVVGKRIE